MNDTVPVVDVGGWHTSSGSGRVRIANAVTAVCEGSGFLLVAGHGVDPDLVQAMDEITKRFFHLPVDEKLRSASRSATVARGYRPQGTALAKSLGVETPADLVEAFTINNPRRETAPSTVSDDLASYFAPNVWPSSPEDLQPIWERYYAALETVMRTMLHIFAAGLGLEESWFDAKFETHYSSLLANFYPRQEQPPLPGQLRRGAHADYGAFTLLYQDDAPGGLEILDEAHGWLSVPHVPGTFVLNIGDLLAAWTNDRWVSTMHRVVNPPADAAVGERLSVPFFVNPNIDALVECIPTCAVPGEPPHHAPVRAGDWVLGKHKKTVADHGT